MAGKATVAGRVLQGVRLLERLAPLLERLRPAGCARDRAGNRRLFYDQLCSLILLTFFNPTLKTLRDLQRASGLRTVRRKLGCERTSIGSLSEALRVFDPALLGHVVQELLGRVPHAPAADPRLKAVAQTVTNVDSTLLRQLPQVTEACFARRKDRGWRLHTHFEVLRGVPVRGEVTPAGGGPAAEKAVLKRSLEPDRCYVLDRGYEEFALFNQIVRAGSSYVCRVRQDHHFQAEQQLPPSAEAAAAGVRQDALGVLGSSKSRRIEHPDHRQRRIVVQLTLQPRPEGRRRAAAPQELVLVTNQLDVPAEVIVLLYRYRWLIELFFRWLKCVLRCRHLLSQAGDGIQIQMDCALIACLLIQLAVGRDLRPTAWTYKLLCLYAQGWAQEDEVLAHLRERSTHPAPQPHP